MEGNYCFTICGDPLYFAPEIVTQQGYDYSVDLWSFGILLYELLEGSNPFGTPETDETSIFRTITAYQPSTIPFSKNIQAEAKSLIISILQYNASSRAGYRYEATIKDADYFSGTVGLLT